MQIKPLLDLGRFLQEVRDLAAAFLRGLCQMDFVLAVFQVIGENVGQFPFAASSSSVR